MSCKVTLQQSAVEMEYNCGLNVDKMVKMKKTCTLTEANRVTYKSD